ncbi:PEP/pyruvate-binding domain-containing protein [Streptomyces caniscabiei]|uniref:PEP/pyruvate-binding domain-containing protein n=1 Tax=Streptomyces caniscabiei TaxID=2746961 RepID=UPI0029B6BAC2|nr:PEP/pyruvate-binding domain-containing protein [Streptomyces caniscabiei]MDX2776046.1 PEP/pyruvate-binding domain-containing protein [Streptomyces caniscabiei]
MNLIKLTDCQGQPLNKIGGKALGLAKLTSIPGAVTSPGFVVPAGYAATKSELDELWRELSLSCVAVRSSGVTEDSSKESLAGKYDTLLGVTADKLTMSIEQVRRSASDTIPVIVQNMVASVVSGVMFTHSPTDQSLIMLSTAHGLGRVIAEGECIPQTVTINVRNEIKFTNELDQPYCYLLEECRIIQSKDVPRTAPLADNEIVGIAELGREIEKCFGKPQDIEWAMDKDRQLFTLQSRPITTR